VTVTDVGEVFGGAVTLRTQVPLVIPPCRRHEARLSEYVVPKRV
jgi:hypothetical protein